MAKVRVEIDRVMKSGMHSGRPVGTMVAFMPETRIQVRRHSRERAARARAILAQHRQNNRQSDRPYRSWIEEGPGLPGKFRNIDRTISLMDNSGGHHQAGNIEFGTFNSDGTRRTAAVAPLRRAVGIL